jgi:hypothetical protein
LCVGRRPPAGRSTRKAFTSTSPCGRRIGWPVQVVVVALTTSDIDAAGAKAARARAEAAKIRYNRMQ